MLTSLRADFPKVMLNNAVAYGQPQTATFLSFPGCIEWVKKLFYLRCICPGAVIHDTTGHLFIGSFNSNRNYFALRTEIYGVEQEIDEHLVYL